MCFSEFRDQVFQRGHDLDLMISVDTLIRLISRSRRDLVASLMRPKSGKLGAGVGLKDGSFLVIVKHGSLALTGSRS